MSILFLTVSLSDLALLLDLTERRVQQLAREGVVVKESRGRYRLVLSVQGYLLYIGRASQKRLPPPPSTWRVLGEMVGKLAQRMKASGESAC